MDIQDLRTFVEVAKTGGVTAAARRMGVAKAVVSRRLIRLEAELGIQLLSRTTRGATLTEAGAIYREFAEKVVSDLEIARDTIMPRGELSGRLRIAAPLTFGPTHFAPALAELAQQHPDLHIHMSYSDRYVDLIEEGFDCAIRFGRLAPSSLLATKIGPVHATLVASPDYIAAHGSPETPKELLEHEAIMQGTEAWYFLDGDTPFSINPQGKIKADNGVAISALVLAGLGIALLPDALIAEHLKSGALVPVMTRFPPPVYGIFVVRPPAQHPSRKVRVMTEFLKSRFSNSDCVSGPARAPSKA